MTKPVNWRRRGRRLLLGVTSLVLALAAAEIAVRISGAAREVGPSLLVFDSRLAARLRPDVAVRRSGAEFTFTVTTDSLGHRGPEPERPIANAVVCLGDSFTMGHGVEDGQEFPALLRGELGRNHEMRAPVVNAGVPGTGTGRWIKMLEDEARTWSPAAVILQVCGNDYFDDAKEKLYSLGPDDALVEGPPLERSWSQAAQSWIGNLPGVAHSHLLALLRQALARDSGDTRPQPAIDSPDAGPTASRAQPDDDRRLRRDRLTLKILEKALRLCSDQGWPVIVLTVGVYDRRLQDLRTLCSHSSIPVLVAPSRTERPDLYFTIDGHWTPAGHRHAAQMVLESIRSNPRVIDRLRKHR